MRAELLVAALVVTQGLWLGASPPWVALAALVTAVAWWFGPTRHGAASVALGGLGMLLGGALDQSFGLAPSCHAAGARFGFATLGMALACTAGCVCACRAAGREGARPGFHSVTLLAMFAGEEATRAIASVMSWPLTHALMVFGMGLGTLTGAWVAGVLMSNQTSDRAGRAAPGSPV